MSEQMKGTPVSLNARLAEKVVDFLVLKARMDADGVREPAEVNAVIDAGTALANDAGPLTETIEVCVTALTGSRGAASPKFLRKVRVIDRRVKLLRFPAIPDPLEAA
jgi:hypothetical protein